MFLECEDIDNDILELGLFDEEDWDIGKENTENGLPRLDCDISSVKEEDNGSSNEGSISCGCDNSREGRKRRRVSKDEDSLKINQAAEAMFSMLNLDPNSKEGKLQKRKLRNRMSAAQHRERKKELIDTLEDKLKEKEKEINALKLEVAQLSAENSKLKERLGGIYSKPPSHSEDLTSSESESESTTSSSKRKTFGSPVSAGISLLSFMFIFSFSFNNNLYPQLDFHQPVSSAPLPTSRFLLSTPSLDISQGWVDLPSQSKQEAKYIIHTSEKSINNPTIPSLYSYQDKLLQLYPPHTEEQPLKVNVRPSSIPLRSNLRSRRASADSSENERSLVPIYSDFSLQPRASQIYVSHARALLDPQLLASHFLPSPHSSSTDTPHSTGSPDEKALSTYRVLSSLQNPMAGASVVSMAGVGAGNNMLMMVLPASAVRWGSSWEESTDNLLENLIKREILKGETQQGVPLDSNSSSLWVEIGCSVFKAQLVRNVTVTA